MERTSFSSNSNFGRGGSMSRSGSGMSGAGLSKSSGSLKVRATGGSTRRMGDDMEEQIMEELAEAGLSFQLTRNSGATNGDGDMKGHGFMVECKYKTSKSHTVRTDEWVAVKQKSETHHLTPLLLTENEDHERMVHMKYEDFVQMLAEKELG